MERSRVLFVIPTLTLGGAERIFATLLGYIDATSFDLSLAMGDSSGISLTDSLPAHVNVIDLAAPRVRKAIPKLVSLLWTMRPQVVLSTLDHLNLALCASRPFWPPGTRHIARATSVVSLENQRYRLAMRLFYPKADAIVFQSQFMRSKYESALGFRHPAAAVINNPIDVAAVRRGARDRTIPPDYDRQKLNLVAVGRFEAVKGFDLLARALAKLDDRFALTIVGDGGGDRERFQSLVAFLGLEEQVRLVGYQRNPYPFIEQADALVLPSRSEGFPNVVLEALALGVPVVSTPVAGLDQLLGSLPNCVVAEAISDTALATALARFASFSKATIPRDAVIAFYADQVAGQYEALIRRVCLRGFEGRSRKGRGRH